MRWEVLRVGFFIHDKSVLACLANPGIASGSSIPGVGASSLLFGTLGRDELVA